MSTILASLASHNWYKYHGISQRKEFYHPFFKPTRGLTSHFHCIPLPCSVPTTGWTHCHVFLECHYWLISLYSPWSIINLHLPWAPDLASVPRVLQNSKDEKDEVAGLLRIKWWKYLVYAGEVCLICKVAGHLCYCSIY